MRGDSFFTSTPFRVSIAYILLFMLAYLGANLVAARLVLNFLDSRLTSVAEERYREIETAYTGRGLAGAIAMINSHGPAIRGEETIYTLRDPSGVMLAGNTALTNIPPDAISVQLPQGEAWSTYKLVQGKLGDNGLIVGINSGGSDELARIVLISLAWTTAIVFMVGLGGAALLRYRMRRRIILLSETAHAIGHGELSQRLPISPQRDEIDVLCSEINVALAALEASVGVMKQVTTDIAHDLKTPISRTFLVLEEALQADSLEAARAAIEAGLAELQLIADTFEALLRIARIEAGSRRSRFAPVDLNSVMHDICDAYEASAADSGYQLSCRAGPAAAMIMGDANLIRQMLANLVANAMQHTPVGTEIRLRVASRPGAVLLGVFDNGPGIPPSERQRVFDRFYRLEKSRTTSGTGLGLSLVKAIAELHGATIELRDNGPGLAVLVRFRGL